MSRSEKAEATRQSILDRGQMLVLQKGFVGVGLQEILKASGVPKGSFYYYFPSKEAFGCALLQRYVEGYLAQMDQLLAADLPDGRIRLMRYWSAWLAGPEDPARGWAEDCLVVKLAAEVADLSEDMRRVLNDGVAALVARIAGMIAEARADGSLPAGAPPQALAQMLYQMWLGAALLTKLSRDRTAMQQAFTATEALLVCPGPQAATPNFSGGRS
ncbi:TetR/AcrR family transcriptional regulator [Pseudodonghicola flavimaris]|uniref:TetR/AcrR family transcriptional regulator n=1 Tax=Pseudodonghicola flavimaris TaxID=3050036 RepID=A0ABT7EUN5_9RHOB|nr:TetR/AcrR family transcriptional regulator [Pseudodonghicola flavimaris]MDK3016054.1 TetR/AcrR family transcriptional regulator [Pseudodonghicola flavimaris]